MNVRLTEREGAVQFRIRVSAGASANRISGVHDGMLKISVTTAPEKGKANKAIVRLLAHLLDVNKTQIEIVAGLTAQTKTIQIRDIRVTELKSKIVAIC